MTTADTLQRLQTGTLEIEGVLPWSSNYTFLARVCGEGWELSAVYKPQKGERPLWDFPQGTLCHREYAAFVVSNELGWDLVAPTAMRDGPHGLGSVQLFVEHDPEYHYFSFEHEPAFKPQLQRIVLFDLLINNADRKSGHVLVEEAENSTETGKLWAIDHGVCFHSDYKLRTVIWEFAGNPISKSLMANLVDLQQKLRTPAATIYAQLEELLSSLERQALQKRLDRLIKQAVFPNPGPGRHYPWPPV
jgi:uncharacterized repeat protein (TIGR03843 family)